jgi:hypothetical protein
MPSCGRETRGSIPPSHSDLISSRFAYLSVSRARFDAQIYTNDDAGLKEKLGNNVSQSSGIAPTRTMDLPIRDVGIGL